MVDEWEGDQVRAGACFSCALGLWVVPSASHLTAQQRWWNPEMPPLPWSAWAQDLHRGPPWIGDSGPIRALAELQP